MTVVRITFKNSYLVVKMLSLGVIVFSVLLNAAWSEDLRFPEGFKFGVASAAYQVEGAWNVSDKGESIWDRFTHKHPDAIKHGHNGDVACDSYHLWKQDIDLVEEVGAKFYRFSISWPRLLPYGFINHVSEDGRNYYNNLIDGLMEKGIEPVVTLYHWDLPQKLQDLGGWANPLISDWFSEYARLVYSLYGDRVKTWITINEAWVVCDISYIAGIFAPGVFNPVGGYICNKNILMAHAKAWRVYDEEFKPKYKGIVSLANHLIWMEAENDSEEEAAELIRNYMVGRYSHPIYSKEGGWPLSIEKIIAENSKKEGYPHSKLPAWTKEEIDLVKGSYDYYGMNFYTSRIVRKAKPGEQLGPWPTSDAPEVNIKMYFHPDWPNPFSYFAVHPEGIRKQLAWLKSHYGDIPVIITENGCPTLGGLDDIERIDYYKQYLKQVLLAIKEDGVNVTAYTAWTIIDNFEWTLGYESKYGLYEVDFDSPNRTRSARASAKFYTEVIKEHSLDVTYNFTASRLGTTEVPVSKEPGHSNNTIIIGLIIVVIIIAIAGLGGCVIRNGRNKKKRSKSKQKIHNDLIYSNVKSDETKLPLRQ